MSVGARIRGATSPGPLAPTDRDSRGRRRWALWLSAPPCGWLDAEHDSTTLWINNPQQRYDVLLEKGRIVGTNVTSQVTGGRHPQAPAHLAELAVRGLSVRVALPWPTEAHQPALTVLIRSIVPKIRVPSPSTITSSGDQKTTISRRTALKAGTRSYVGESAGESSTAHSTVSLGSAPAPRQPAPFPPTCRPGIPGRQEIPRGILGSHRRSPRRGGRGSPRWSSRRASGRIHAPRTPPSPRRGCAPPHHIT